MPPTPPLITVSTANFYTLPFERALDLIAAAGFREVELDLFVEYKDWGMAQHLRGWPARDVAAAIQQRGLHVASIHDGGGVLPGPASLQGYINPLLDETLNALGYAPGCIVFHTPHVTGSHDPLWWQPLAGQIRAALQKYHTHATRVTLENLYPTPDYTIPFSQPEALLDFLSGTPLGITVDTIHYAQAGVDIVRAARVLGGRVFSVHLSDTTGGPAHLYPGDGNLDLGGFFRTLSRDNLYTVTLECNFHHPGEDLHELPDALLVKRLAAAGELVAGWLSAP